MSTPQQPVGASLVVLFDRDRRLLLNTPKRWGKPFSKEYVERELYPRGIPAHGRQEQRKETGFTP